MPLTLSEFAQRQRTAQGLSVKTFARRAGLGLSHAYQILRGERTRTSADTFEAVARGLNMTPAEMLVLMGRSAGDLSADEAETLALYRGTTPEQRPTIKQMLRGLVPIERTESRRRRVTASSGPRPEPLQVEGIPPSDAKSGPEDPVARHYANILAITHSHRRPLATA